MKERFEFSDSHTSVQRTIVWPDGRGVITRLECGCVPKLDEDAHTAFDQAFLRSILPPRHGTPDDAPIRVVDLFCGCGGLSLGAREACRAAGLGFLPVAAVDMDEESLEVYARNLGSGASVRADVCTLLDGEIGSQPTAQERAFAGKCGQVDILLAGPPCQGYSDLNNHTRRRDTRNALYERVARAVEITRPKHVLIENVPTVVHDEKGRVHQTIKVLRELEYAVDEAVLDLAEIGIPQRRKRHVVAASRSKTPVAKDWFLRHRVARSRSVMWAIGDLQTEPPNGIFTTPSVLSKENIERVRYLFEHACYDLPNDQRPRCHQDGNHSYKSMYGRMRPDECAQTITGGFGSPGQGRFIHPTQRRIITPHEAARLQFFPDFYDFSSAKKRTSLARMIGNAVPTKLAYVFCLEFLA